MVAVPKPPVAPQELTYEEYLRTPLIQARYDIIDGVMTFMSPAPVSYHQILVVQLLTLLNAYVKDNQLGIVLTAPTDVIIRKEPKLQTRQPDVFYLSTARTGITARKDFRTMPQIEVKIDLVVEILSPDEVRLELVGKLRDYAAIDVTEVWLVSPQEETVEVRRLAAGQYVSSGRYGIGDEVKSLALPQLALTVEAIFS